MLRHDFFQLKDDASVSSMSLQSVNSTESNPTPPILPLGRRNRANSEGAMTDDGWVKTPERTAKSASPERVMYVPVDDVSREESGDNDTISSRETLTSRETLILEDAGMGILSSSPLGFLAQTLTEPVAAAILPQHLADRKKSLANIVTIDPPASSPPPAEKSVKVISPHPAHLKHRLNNGRQNQHQ